MLLLKIRWYHAMRLGLLLACGACCGTAAEGQVDQREAPIALVGGTIIDVDNGGTSTHDVPSSVVLLEGQRIIAAGPSSSIAIPANAHVVDVHGKFLLPGLVDGFAGLNSQGQADATLAMGVTTIVGSGDDARSKLKLDARPRPHIYVIDTAGSTDDYSRLIHDPQWSKVLKDPASGPRELSFDQTRLQLEATAKLGTRAILLGHNLTSANVQRMIALAHRLGMVTYGEFVATPDAVGISSGVDLLLHMSRYELGLAPPALQAPFRRDPEGPTRALDRFLMKLPPEGASVHAYARSIRAHNVALMPTFSLFYLMLPNHRNLWNEPAARVLDPAGLELPPDRQTGEAPVRSQASRAARERFALAFWKLNLGMEKEHPRYLAASGASAFGTMPGISLHTELELLVRLGLTPRQALASATSNYATAFGWKELGALKPGRRGDVLVLNADPRASITNTRNIAMIYLAGSSIDRDALIAGRSHE